MIPEIGVVVKEEQSDQPIDDESGELLLGPGTGGLQPRVSEAKRALPKLVREQEERLAQAKRFAMEQSVQHVGEIDFTFYLINCEGLYVASQFDEYR